MHEMTYVCQLIANLFWSAIVSAEIYDPPPDPQNAYAAWESGLVGPPVPGALLEAWPSLTSGSPRTGGHVHTQDRMKRARNPRHRDAVEIVDSISGHKASMYRGSDRCASFASKYCHFFLDERVFPIYDSFALASVKSLLGRVSRGLTPGRSQYWECFCAHRWARTCFFSIMTHDPRTVVGSMRSSRVFVIRASLRCLA